MIARPTLRVIAGFTLFCVGYLIINQQLLTEAIFYRLAVSDYYSSAIAFLLAAAQACVLLICVLIPGRILFRILMVLGTLSALTNVIFVQILGEMLSNAKFSWLLTEARQAENAAGEFPIPIVIGLVKSLLAIALFVASRAMMRPRLLVRVPVLKHGSKFVSGAVLVLAAVPSLLYVGWNRDPQMAERNIYSYAMMLATAPPPPERPQASFVPDESRAVQKIVWIVDESINYSIFKTLLSIEASSHGFINFGMASSLSNCSGPSNLAMRSGVPIPTLSNRTDLRKRPSIWRYAKKSGYRTSLWDGQVSAAPQNMLFEPELALIDDYVSAADGIDTDRKLAQKINQEIKQPGQDFIMAILRGVHFQYSDHYPKGTLPPEASLAQQYAAAVGYSKKDFFSTLLKGVEDDNVIIVYVSDHGQHVKEGTMTHCSVVPDPAEFQIPLAIKMPEQMKAQYSKVENAKYSASQIFPTTLGWMGYDETDLSASYDAALPSASLRRVWFGRDVIPVSSDHVIELNDFAAD